MTRRTLLRLLSLIAPLRGTFVLSTLMRMLNQLLGAALLVTAVWGTMKIVQGGSNPTLPALALLLAGLGLLKGLCRYLEQFTGHYVAFRLLSEMRCRLFDKLEALAPAGLGRDRSGDLLSRAISDIERIEVFYAHTIAPAAVAVLVPPIIVLALARVDVRLALLAVPFLLAVGIVVPWISRRMAGRSASVARRSLADLGACLTEGILGLRDVVALGAGNGRLAALDDAGRTLSRAQGGLARAGAFQNGATDLLIGGATLAVLGLGWSLSGSIPPENLPVAVALTISAFLPLLGISNLVPDFEQAIESAARIFAILDRESAPARPTLAGSDPCEKSAGIVFDSVSFMYPDGTRALSNVTFHAGAGESIAFTGPSGSGKSTILHLLLRFHDVSSGAIRVFGQDVRSLEAGELRDRFAVVSQRSHIFQTTIRENLLIARPAATREEIDRAVRMAQLDEFVAALPEGLDTQIGALGGTLSGGQRQRLAIARAFLKDTPVLIFDEATSHLDLRHELEARRAIGAWMNERVGRIALVVSHRKESLREADRVFVVEDGSLFEAGFPAQGSA